MRRSGPVLALLPALALVFALPADARQRHGLRPGAGTANPSALVAAEIAFARAAREKGQWTAFREFADDAAVMFTPEPVIARDWLKGRADPAAPVQWQTHQVWMSCDGSLGVTRGGWHGPDGAAGSYVTVWKRQKKGDYRWVLDQGDSLDAAPAEPDMLSASVAQCPTRRGDAPPPPAAETPREAGTAGGGSADDGTLTWRWQFAADGTRSLAVALRKDGAMQTVLSLNTPLRAP